MNRKLLLKNTIYLYLLTLCSALSGFIIIPYETRVLGPYLYGLLSYGLTIALLSQLVVDFGFLIKATKEIAQSDQSIGVLSVIFSEVFYCKFILIVIVLFLFLFATFQSEILCENFLFFFLSLIYGISNSLLPDFIYRGKQNMKPITIRNFLAKLLSVFCIFLFFKEPGQYLYIPVCLLAGSILGLVLSFYDLIIKEKITFVKVSLSQILDRFRDTFLFFLSSLFSTTLTSSNVIILTYFCSPTISGYYSAAEKIILIVKFLAAPIADALLPYLIKSYDEKLIKRIFYVTCPIALFIFISVNLNPTQIGKLIYGAEFSNAGTYITLLSPIILIVLPTYLFGYPLLSSINKERFANYSVIFSLVLYVFGISILYLLDKLNASHLCLLTVGVEYFLFIFRFVCFFVMKKRKE